MSLSTPANHVSLSDWSGHPPTGPENDSVQSFSRCVQLALEEMKLTHQPLLCPLVSVVPQEEEWESGLQFLQATDSRRLEKKPGRRKKLWIGLGLLLASAAVALLTGLLVWHFHRELPSNKPLFKTRRRNRNLLTDCNQSVLHSSRSFYNVKTKCAKIRDGFGPKWPLRSNQQSNTYRQKSVVLKKPKTSNHNENSFYRMNQLFMAAVISSALCS